MPYIQTVEYSCKIIGWKKISKLTELVNDVSFTQMAIKY